MHKTSLLRTVIFAITFLVFAGGHAAYAQSGTTIGVVDMERVFEESAAAKAAMEQMRALLNEAQARLTGLRSEVQNLEQQLQQLAAGSERALELTRLRALKAAELEAEQNFGMARVQLLRLQANLQIYSLARQAIADVARQKNLGLVLRKAPPLPPAITGRTNAQDVENTIHQQVVVFSAPEHDITGDVLVRMDELVRTGAATQPGAGNPATSRPAAP